MLSCDLRHEVLSQLRQQLLQGVERLDQGSSRSSTQHMPELLAASRAHSVPHFRDSSVPVHCRAFLLSEVRVFQVLRVSEGNGKVFPGEKDRAFSRSLR